MGPAELMISLASAPLLKQAVSALVDTLLSTVTSQVPKAAAGAMRSALADWKTEQGLKCVCERSKQLRKVKTIWQVERELDLVKFYYPSKVRSAGGRAEEVHRAAELPVAGNLIIRGTVGQGKSIFMRYLAARELFLGESVAVLIELRRLSAQQSVVEHAVEELKNLGLSSATPELFEALVASGRLLLLLDGFDEVEESRVGALVNELESLVVRRESLRVLVTSRPGAALEHSPHFRVVDLAPLAPGEYPKVIARIAHNAKQAEEIVDGVKRGHESIARLLTTPLMVSLLVVHYRIGQGIPENRVAFYDPIFFLLLQRHDKAKAGWIRPRHSKLSDHELRNFFNCLCFISRRRGVSVVKEHELLGLATKAVSWLPLPGCKPESAIDDIARITCLLLREGDEYRFIHKSVQEFHAACFVRDQPDPVATDFYGSLAPHWKDWTHELLFLEAIDGYRFNCYFAVPLLERVVSTLPGASPFELGCALIGRLTMRVSLVPEFVVHSHSYPHDQVGWCLVQYFEGTAEFAASLASAAEAVAKRKSPRGESFELAFDELLAEIGHDQPEVVRAAESLGRRLLEQLQSRRARVHTVDERRGLLEL